MGAMIVALVLDGGFNHLVGLEDTIEVFCNTRTSPNRYNTTVRFVNSRSYTSITKKLGISSNPNSSIKRDKSHYNVIIPLRGRQDYFNSNPRMMSWHIRVCPVYTCWEHVFDI